MGLDILFIFILLICIVSCFVISVFIFYIACPDIKTIIINKTKRCISAWEKTT